MNPLEMMGQGQLSAGAHGLRRADISSSSGYRQTVILSTRGLSLIEFKPPANVVEPLVREAESAVARYFNQGLPLSEVHPDV